MVSPDATTVPVGMLQEGFLFFFLICSYLATIHSECSSQVATFQRWVKQALSCLSGFLQDELSLLSLLPLLPPLLMGTTASLLLTECVWRYAWNNI